MNPDVDYPTVVNPEAIGDPDASPIVQLPPGAAALIRLPPPRDGSQTRPAEEAPR